MQLAQHLTKDELARSGYVDSLLSFLPKLLGPISSLRVRMPKSQVEYTYIDNMWLQHNMYVTVYHIVLVNSQEAH